MAQAGAMTAEQAAIMALQGEVAQLRQSVQTSASAHDALRAAHEALNAAAQTALAQRDAQIRSTEERLRALIFRQSFDLLDAKDMKVDAFKGGQTEAFKPWQKKFKAWANAKRTGFRGALEWAERQTMEITDLNPMGWDEAEAAAPKLYDTLLQVLQGPALLLIEKPGLENSGFEAWRILVQQYAPSGGAYELDSMMALMTISQCKSLHELPAAVAKFERDVDAYERRSGRIFPVEFKTPAFLRMIPKSHMSDMRWRFSQGSQDYETLKTSILTFSQHLRMENAYSRGDNDMQVDSFDDEEQWGQQSGGYSGATDESWSGNAEDVNEHETDESVDALYKKGKGKGKSGKGAGITYNSGGGGGGMGRAVALLVLVYSL